MVPSVPPPTFAARARRSAWLVVAGAVLLVACGDGGDDGTRPFGEPDSGPNRGATPTLVGGLELPPVDPARVLVGENLAFGAPLPSEQAAADAFAESPEVAKGIARRVYATSDGRQVGDVSVLQLDGQALFDREALGAYARSVVEAFGGGAHEDVTLGGRTVVRSAGEDVTAIGFLEGNQLVVTTGPDAHDVQVVVERQLAGISAGVAGSTQPVTPLVPLPIDAAFVAVPTLTFEPIPPPEEETPPEVPVLPGATASQGRYGVVAGERRSLVWAFTLDPVAYPSAEALEPAMASLASNRAGGAPASVTEVVDRVVLAADGAEDQPSTRAFRHGGLVLLVEGADPAQLDAVVTAWITALGSPAP